MSSWQIPWLQIAAVLNPEDKGEVCLQVHAGRRAREVEQEMLIWKTLTKKKGDNHPAVSLFPKLYD
ncbi:MAG TPA: hypothetical protein VF177_22085 [Anaerolineae bacterium]